jgi:plasmid stabilization system protein ParE
MAAELALAPEAERDIAEAYAWYEDRRVGLGEEFLSRLEARIQAILRAPEAHPTLIGTFRRALVRRFPYAIFYEVVADVVTIYCVVHTSSDPEKWRQRLS